MPRRDDKYRDIAVTISEEAIYEALATWVEKWHNDKIDTATIEFDFDPETKKIRKATAIKKATKVKTKPDLEPPNPEGDDDA